MIFDSHAHYDDIQFDADRDQLLTDILPKKGVVGILNMAASLDSIATTVALTQQYPRVWGAVGIHPECAADLPPNYLAQIEAAAAAPKIVAIGEIGLDYYYEEACPRERQKTVFSQQLALAKRLSLPVVLHDRDAHGDMLQILQHTRPKGVLHCFSGSREMAKQVLQLGLFIGLGGVVTFKNARQSVEVAAEIPLSRLLLETDAPYLAPVPLRGKRNDSSLIAYIATKIAEIRGISCDEVLNASRENIRALFGI